MMTKEFVPYDRALRMKALGFNEVCFGRYGEVDNLEFRFFKEPKSFDYGLTSKTCLAPTFSQAFRWFREKGYHSGIVPRYDEFYYHIKDFTGDEEYCDPFKIMSYEEAELACLDKLIEIIESKSE